MRTFSEFMELKPKTEEGELLVQAIDILSTQPAFEKMTPTDIYRRIVKLTLEVKEDAINIKGN